MGFDFVAVFTDLSMLFATHMDGDAYLCQNPDGSKFYVDMEIIGGTGRFDGAGGYFRSEGDGYSVSIGVTPPLSAESGKFIEEIEFND